jgi:hypothetical protein
MGSGRAKDEDLIELAKKELEQLGLCKQRDVFDGCVVRQPKAYPVYDDVSTPKHVEAVREGPRAELPGSAPRRSQRDAPLQQLRSLDDDRHADGGEHRERGPQKFDPWRVNQDAQYIEAGRSGEERLIQSGGRSVPRKVEDAQKSS